MHLRPYPADGTFISDVDTGQVFEVAGGAPLYIASGDASQVPGWGSQPVVTTSSWEFGNYVHLRPYPADGTFISDVDTGQVFEVAGGAPLYIASGDASQVPGWGSQPVVTTSSWEFGNYVHLRPYPADGTFICNVDNGDCFETAGGAPLYVTLGDSTQIPGWTSQPITATSGWEFGNYEHLRPYPANGTFITSMTGGQYRIAGGAALPISDCSELNGCPDSTTVDSWDLQNPNNPLAHLNSTPSDSTSEGLSILQLLAIRTRWTDGNLTDILPQWR